MKIESLDQNALSVVQNNNGLKVYLNNLLVGRAATPRSWLAENQSDTEVLNEWLKKLDAVKELPNGELVYQFDTSQLKKWGPQGEVKPIKELMDIVTEGFGQAGTPQPALYRTPRWQEAKRNFVRKYIQNTGLWRRLTPRDPEHVIDDMRSRDTLESNSGWPEFSRRSRPEVLAQAIADCKSGAWREYPAIALFRNYNQKTRLVWMYPMATNIQEGRFSQPLKEAFMRTSASAGRFFAPWHGYSAVLKDITDAYDRGFFLAATDFSHTDAHFTKWDMLEVFDCIKFAFQERYEAELKESLLHVVQIPLVIGPDTIIRGDHGVSSGSNWTNDSETYFDAMFEEFFLVLHLVVAAFNAIGDDIAHQVDFYDPQLQDKMGYWYHKANKDMQPEKATNFPNHVKYLQRLTIRGYYSDRVAVDPRTHEEFRPLRGIYSTVRALNSSLNPEKFHKPALWSKDMFAARQFMILENCIDHPLFAEFVRFVISKHDYLREFARLPKHDLDEILRKSRLLPGLNPTYNQEKRDQSLATYASIKIARE